MCIEELVRRLSQVFGSNNSYEFEALIVENGSTDRTWEILQGVHAVDPRFKVIRLARNFRMDGGITAGPVLNAIPTKPRLIIGQT